ncbi:MAG: hypothetical protein LC794_04875 [Acidobacteria bacterium]|nr:hypothetical protein [Acidobacteriota bacterium]
MRLTYAKNPLSDFRATRGSVAQLLPVIKPTARDDVVDRRKCPLRVIQMTVQHTR